MATLYAIQCRFKIKERQDWIEGIAICRDPDTVQTFIYPNGMPYNGEDIWNYKLNHYAPWAGFEVGQ